MNIICKPGYCIFANREQVFGSCTTCADINLCYYFLISPVDSCFFYKSSSIALIISIKRIDDRTFSQRRICNYSLAHHLNRLISTCHTSLAFLTGEG